MLADVILHFSRDNYPSENELRNEYTFPVLRNLLELFAQLNFIIDACVPVLTIFINSISIHSNSKPMIYINSQTTATSRKIYATALAILSWDHSSCGRQWAFCS